MLKLEELDVYRMAMEIGERVWAVADGWNFFAKDTVGKQLVRAADSIAANIAEGYGRYHYKENKLFCYYARGSLMETKTWLQKAFQIKTSMALRPNWTSCISSLTHTSSPSANDLMTIDQ